MDTSPGTKRVTKEEVAAWDFKEEASAGQGAPGSGRKLSSHRAKEESVLDIWQPRQGRGLEGHELLEGNAGYGN
jgi:hypothetical protein